jgi:hypothetical protein
LNVSLIGLSALWATNSFRAAACSVAAHCRAVNKDQQFVPERDRVLLRQLCRKLFLRRIAPTKSNTDDDGSFPANSSTHQTLAA